MKKNNLISLLGYKDNSPFKKRKSLLIDSPSKLITMDGVSIPLLATDETGFSKLLMPNSGTHIFNGTKIKEQRLFQNGGLNNPFGNPRDFLKRNVSDNTIPGIVKQDELSKQQLDRIKAQIKNLKQGKVPTVIERATTIAKNKTYADSNPYAKIDEQGNLVPKQYDRNIAGTPDYGSRAAKNDKALEHAEGALDAATLITPGISLAGKGLRNIGKYLTERTALKNAYKINPLAFKPNSEMMYRGIGKEGMEDAISSGVFRAKQNVEPIIENGFDMSKQFNSTYYTPKFKTADQYGNGYIAEVPKDVTTFRNRYKRGKDWSQIADENIPIEKGRILKKDWIQGYKEIPKNKPGEVYWNGENYQSTPLSNPKIISQSSGMDAVYAKQPGYNAHLFKKQGYVPPTDDPNLMAYQSGGNTKDRCPDGYYFNYVEGKCMPLTENGRFNVDVYTNSTDRSSYLDRNIDLRPNATSDEILHEEAHAEQDRQGMLSTYSSAPMNKGLFNLADDTTDFIFDARRNQLKSLVDDFKGTWKQAYPNKLYPKEFDFLSRDLKTKLVDEDLMYKNKGTIEYDANQKAKEQAMKRIPKAKQTQLNWRQLGGFQSGGFCPDGYEQNEFGECVPMDIKFNNRPINLRQQPVNNFVQPQKPNYGFVGPVQPSIKTTFDECPDGYSKDETGQCIPDNGYNPIQTQQKGIPPTTNASQANLPNPEKKKRKGFSFNGIALAGALSVVSSGLNAFSNQVEEGRKRAWNRSQLATNFNQTYSNAQNDYGVDPYEQTGQLRPLLKYGGIHIKPENKGKFNALKQRTGKSTEELTHSKNPLTRKRAIFAQNAAKWKHQQGGKFDVFKFLYGDDDRQQIQQSGQIEKKQPIKKQSPRITDEDVDLLTQFGISPEQLLEPKTKKVKKETNFNMFKPGGSYVVDFAMLRELQTRGIKFKIL